MGGGHSNANSYEEQKEAIKKGLISFDLNIYLIGENINLLYSLFKKSKIEDNGSLFSFWEYYYKEGNYDEQLKNANENFKINQEKMIKDPEYKLFKEVIIIQFKKKEEKKIEEIFSHFCKENDLYCPFIIFLLEEEDSPGKGIENIVPDTENYQISPLKVFTIKFNINEDTSLLKLYQILFRICSYYNELGDRIIVWPKSNEFPIDYNLIEGDFNSYINIFCLGRTGCGKSTFLNKFFNEKRTKEGGSGKGTTSKIVRFGIDKIPIRFYDIPGFESEETIKLVNDKLSEKTNEMNNDRDTIHLILYFLNYGAETQFYKNEFKIIDTIKKNNKNIKIIFVFTHCNIDPYLISSSKKPNKFKKDEITKKIETLVNNVSSLFGEDYSYNTNYFQKDSVIQKNIIFANLLPNDITDVGEFGFDKIIKSILDSISSGINKNELIDINIKIMDNLANEIPEDKDLDEKIKENINKSYFLKNSTFSIEKDKAIKEATDLYNSMFTYGKVFASFCPIIKDLKMGINKYQKYKFKKELKRIFGFTIENESFKDVKSDYIQMLKKYIQEKDAQRGNKEKENYVEEIRDGYHKKEVNNRLIVANEVVGYASYAFLLNPITFVIGGIGIFGTSYISYSQFKTDCTEYFEQYKKHYEEYKYRSLIDCINSLIYGIEYFEKYLNNLNEE